MMPLSIKIFGVIILLDATMSLSTYMKNNHENLIYEAGRWVRWIIGLAMIFI